MWAWTQMKGPGPALLFLFLVSLSSLVDSAPYDAEQSTEIEYYPVADATGCYYNFEHYDEGDRIITNEPCLNCTCHNRMLMCYLRVCPFTKAIGQDCKVEKKPDQCCPIITCPEVPVQLVPHSSTTPSTAIGHLNEYGCSIDNLFYADGAKVPSNPSNPCEVCYCIRNKTACIIQECTLTGKVVEGCRPVYIDGVCCPLRYDCDHPEIETTPRPRLTTTSTTTLAPTTTLTPNDCIYNNELYSDGALVKKDVPCEQCYCMRGDIVCAVQECGPTPLDKVNCSALPPKEGQCCPDTYDCDKISEEDLTTLSSYQAPTTEPTVVSTDKPVEVIQTTVAEEIVPDTKLAAEVTTQEPVAESFTSKITEAVTSSITDIVESITSTIYGSSEKPVEEEITSKPVEITTPLEEHVNEEPTEDISLAAQKPENQTRASVETTTHLKEHVNEEESTEHISFDGPETESADEHEKDEEAQGEHQQQTELPEKEHKPEITEQAIPTETTTHQDLPQKSDESVKENEIPSEIDKVQETASSTESAKESEPITGHETVTAVPQSITTDQEQGKETVTESAASEPASTDIPESIQENVVTEVSSQDIPAPGSTELPVSSEVPATSDATEKEQSKETVTESLASKPASTDIPESITSIQENGVTEVSSQDIPAPGSTELPVSSKVPAVSDATEQEQGKETVTESAASEPASTDVPKSITNIQENGVAEVYSQDIPAPDSTELPVSSEVPAASDATEQEQGKEAVTEGAASKPTSTDIPESITRIQENGVTEVTSQDIPAPGSTELPISSEVPAVSDVTEQEQGKETVTESATSKPASTDIPESITSIQENGVTEVSSQDIPAPGSTELPVSSKVPAASGATEQEQGKETVTESAASKPASTDIPESITSIQENVVTEVSSQDIPAPGSTELPISSEAPAASEEPHTVEDIASIPETTDKYGPSPSEQPVMHEHIATTEAEIMEIVTSVPEKDAEKPQSMDHVSEAAVPKDINKPEEPKVQQPCEESQGCVEPSGDKENEMPPVEEICTKEGCTQAGQGLTEPTNMTAVASETPIVCDSTEGCAPTQEQEPTDKQQPPVPSNEKCTGEGCSDDGESNQIPLEPICADSSDCHTAATGANEPTESNEITDKHQLTTTVTPNEITRLESSITTGTPENISSEQTPEHPEESTSDQGTIEPITQDQSIEGSGYEGSGYSTTNLPLEEHSESAESEKPEVEGSGAEDVDKPEIPITSESSLTTVPGEDNIPHGSSTEPEIPEDQNELTTTAAATHIVPELSISTEGPEPYQPESPGTTLSPERILPGNDSPKQEPELVEEQTEPSTEPTQRYPEPTKQAPATQHTEFETTSVPEISETPAPTQTKLDSSENIGETQEKENAPVDISTSGQTTESPNEVVEHGIPGEGSCLVDGQTYKNNSEVPTINQCQTSCKCSSSILQCQMVACTPPPSNLQDCTPMFTSSDSCCPTYTCSEPGVTNMESDSHVMETTTVGQALSEETSTDVAREPTAPGEEGQKVVADVTTDEVITEKPTEPSVEKQPEIDQKPSETPQSITETTPVEIHTEIEPHEINKEIQPQENEDSTTQHITTEQETKEKEHEESKTEIPKPETERPTIPPEYDLTTQKESGVRDGIETTAKPSDTETTTTKPLLEEEAQTTSPIEEPNKQTESLPSATNLPTVKETGTTIRPSTEVPVFTEITTNQGQTAEPSEGEILLPGHDETEEHAVEEPVTNEKEPDILDQESEITTEGVVKITDSHVTTEKTSEVTTEELPQIKDGKLDEPQGAIQPTERQPEIPSTETELPVNLEDMTNKSDEPSTQNSEIPVTLSSTTPGPSDETITEKTPQRETQKPFEDHTKSRPDDNKIIDDKSEASVATTEESEAEQSTQQSPVTDITPEIVKVQGEEETPITKPPLREPETAYSTQSPISKETTEEQLCSGDSCITVSPHNDTESPVAPGDESQVSVKEPHIPENCGPDGCIPVVPTNEPEVVDCGPGGCVVSTEVEGPTPVEECNENGSCTPTEPVNKTKSPSADQNPEICDEKNGCVPVESKKTEVCGPEGCILQSNKEVQPEGACDDENGCVTITPPDVQKECGPGGCETDVTQQKCDSKDGCVPIIATNESQIPEDCGAEGCKAITPELPQVDCDDKNGCLPTQATQSQEKCGPEGCIEETVHPEQCGKEGCVPIVPNNETSDCGKEGCVPPKNIPEIQQCGGEGCVTESTESLPAEIITEKQVSSIPESTDSEAEQQTEEPKIEITTPSEQIIETATKQDVSASAESSEAGLTESSTPEIENEDENTIIPSDKHEERLHDENEVTPSTQGSLTSDEIAATPEKGDVHKFPPLIHEILAVRTTLTPHGEENQPTDQTPAEKQTSPPGEKTVTAQQPVTETQKPSDIPEVTTETVDSEPHIITEFGEQVTMKPIESDNHVTEAVEAITKSIQQTSNEIENKPSSHLTGETTEITPGSTESQAISEDTKYATEESSSVAPVTTAKIETPLEITTETKPKTADDENITNLQETSTETPASETISPQESVTPTSTVSDVTAPTISGIEEQKIQETSTPSHTEPTVNETALPETGIEENPEQETQKPQKTPTLATTEATAGETIPSVTETMDKSEHAQEHQTQKPQENPIPVQTEPTVGLTDTGFETKPDQVQVTDKPQESSTSSPAEGEGGELSSAVTEPVEKVVPHEEEESQKPLSTDITTEATGSETVAPSTEREGEPKLDLDLEKQKPQEPSSGTSTATESISSVTEHEQEPTVEYEIQKAQDTSTPSITEATRVETVPAVADIEKKPELVEENQTQKLDADSIQSTTETVAVTEIEKETQPDQEMETVKPHDITESSTEAAASGTVAPVTEIEKVTEPAQENDTQRPEDISIPSTEATVGETAAPVTEIKKEPESVKEHDISMQLTTEAVVSETVAPVTEVEKELEPVEENETQKSHDITIQSTTETATSETVPSIMEIEKGPQPAQENDTQKQQDVSIPTTTEAAVGENAAPITTKPESVKEHDISIQSTTEGAAVVTIAPATGIEKGSEPTEETETQTPHDISIQSSTEAAVSETVPPVSEIEKEVEPSLENGTEKSVSLQSTTEAVDSATSPSVTEIGHEPSQEQEKEKSHDTSTSSSSEKPDDIEGQPEKESPSVNEIPTDAPTHNETVVETTTLSEETMYTSAHLTTIAPRNETVAYTTEKSSSNEPVEEELSTSVPLAPMSTTEAVTTPRPTFAPAPIPGEEVPELPEYPGTSDDYDEGPLGPGTCRYGGKVFVSAQQIPREDPCDFCFCFRSDIICLQQSCPPPIPRCHEEPIRGFCCPRYECPVGMATSLNVTTSTTTTTTTLPPNFLAHAYKGHATKAGCQIQGIAYKVGEYIKSASGPCLHCTCGGDGQMKCDPKVCSPEPMLRQMIAAAASRRRR